MTTPADIAREDQLGARVAEMVDALITAVRNEQGATLSRRAFLVNLGAAGFTDPYVAACAIAGEAIGRLAAGGGS